MICTVHHILFEGQQMLRIRENKMHLGFWQNNLREGDLLEDLTLDVKFIISYHLTLRASRMI
jgi:hypothetical protein